MFSRYRFCILAKHRHYSTFEKLGISRSTVKKLESNFNVTHPTLAQEQFIPILINGERDLLIRDRTGTGKTFGTALALASLMPTRHASFESVYSLYVVPNQELAYQIGHWLSQLTDSKHFQIMADINTQLTDIPHTLVGTPGRILDCVNQDNLPLHALERLVLDEADQALSLPKRYATQRQQQKRATHPKPAERLLDHLSEHKHQTVISSATLNRPLRYFLTHQKGWLHSPLFVDLVHGSQLDEKRSATVRHHCLVVSDDAIRNIHQHKQDVQSRDHKADFDDTDERMIESIAILQDIEPVQNAILFVGPTVSVTSIQEKLAEYSIVAKDIKDFNTSREKSKLWIATEFTARGIDMPNVSHVFILGKPVSVTSYLHMAGRTGRLGPSGFGSGKVINIVREHGWTESKMINMYDMLNIPIEKYENVE
ncbi:hypothetical protein CU098_003108 [Rhizopus stolonifer]|uniref:RNA helicase n=1 Tax=Rhizopus stolonifer TaxID=4846 RepID=A0A367IW16_RHIST|nr:hypothetical protein CU098_003108 [Rhizopus stolonifer]